MRQVSQEEFYKTVLPLDVHPTPVGTYDNTTGYRTEWRMQRTSGQRVVGVSDGGTYLCPNRYWLA